MRKRNQYTEEFKKDAVRLMQGRGTRSIEDVAAGIGVGQSMLYRWYQRYAEQLDGGAASSQEEREGVEKLRRRLRELEQENALLKKAAALFAREVK